MIEFRGYTLFAIAFGGLWTIGLLIFLIRVSHEPVKWRSSSFGLVFLQWIMSVALVVVNSITMDGYISCTVLSFIAPLPIPFIAMVISNFFFFFSFFLFLFFFSFFFFLGFVYFVQKKP